MMSRHTTFLEGVKDVLEDEATMKIICNYCNDEIEEIFAQRYLKWRFNDLIAEAYFRKIDRIKVPEDLNYFLQNNIDQDGKILLKVLETREQALKCQKEKMTSLFQQRIEKLQS